ncbi:MAG: efflux RND transporter periplasmic adaptor subunit, partial [Rhodanobacter sp.]
MSRFWKIALIVIAVIVVAAVGFRLLHKPAPAGPASAQSATKSKGGKDGKDETPPVPVTVVPVVKQNVPVYLTALGTVQALNTVTVNPQVGGQLLSLEFTEGQPVKKGQVLAQIDPRTYQAAYDQATAKQRQDQALLETAKSNLTRSQDLAAKGYISKQDLDTLRNTAAQYAAMVAADAASVRDSQVQLAYTKVISPIDGLAGIRNVDPGNVVTTSTGIVTLTQLHPINVMFTLPEQNLDMVRAAAAQEGASLQVTALDRTDSHPIASGGVLKVIDNQIDTSTGTFRLKSEFPNAKNELWPGQFV